MIDKSAASKRTLDGAFALKTRCNQNNPPEVIAAVIGVLLITLAVIAAPLVKRIFG